jgi:urease gamma subunit
MATLDPKTLRDALAEAVVVIDAEKLERSRDDPRVRELFEGGEVLLVELEAKGASG